jgi:hypothetical protein
MLAWRAMGRHGTVKMTVAHGRHGTGNGPCAVSWVAPLAHSTVRHGTAARRSAVPAWHGRAAWWAGTVRWPSIIYGGILPFFLI